MKYTVGDAKKLIQKIHDSGDHDEANRILGNISDAMGVSDGFFVKCCCNKEELTEAAEAVLMEAIKKNER